MIFCKYFIKPDEFAKALHIEGRIKNVQSVFPQPSDGVSGPDYSHIDTVQITTEEETDDEF